MEAVLETTGLRDSSYVGGRTGSNALAGREIFDTVPCDDNLPDIVAGLIQSRRFPSEPVDSWTPSNALPAVASWVPVRTLIPDSSVSSYSDGADCVRNHDFGP